MYAGPPRMPDALANSNSLCVETARPGMARPGGRRLWPLVCTRCPPCPKSKPR